MSEQQILSWLIGEVALFPEKADNHEIATHIADKILPLDASDRADVVGALRTLLRFRRADRASHDVKEDSRREGMMWLALNLAEKCSLVELCSEIESMVADASNGRGFPPYYADMFRRYLRLLERP